MSVHFKLRCENHDVDGPGLRTSAGGSVSMTAETWQFHETGDLDWKGTTELGREEWWSFLRSHEFCILKIVRVG